MIQKKDIDTIITALQEGCDLEIAVHAQSLSLSEVYEWLERGKNEEAKIVAGMTAVKSEAKFLAFWKQTKQARAISIASVQMSAFQATKEDWKAAAWWLEKTMPEKYSKNAEQLPQQEQSKEIESDDN
jgi:hypothetical protein